MSPKTELDLMLEKYLRTVFISINRSSVHFLFSHFFIQLSGFLSTLCLVIKHIHKRKLRSVFPLCYFSRCVCWKSANWCKPSPSHLLNSTQETSAPRESFLPGMMGAVRLVTSHTVTSESDEPHATKLALKKKKSLHCISEHER